MGTAVATITKTSTTNEALTSNTAQNNGGDAFSVSGIKAGGDVTLTDAGALKIAENIAANAFETSRQAEASIAARMEALAQVASDAIDGGLSAASNNTPARAIAAKFAGIAKVAGAVAIAAAVGAVLVYMLKGKR